MNSSLNSDIERFWDKCWPVGARSQSDQDNRRGSDKDHAFEWLRHRNIECHDCVGCLARLHTRFVDALQGGLGGADGPSQVQGVR